MVCAGLVPCHPLLPAVLPPGIRARQVARALVAHAMVALHSNRARAFLASACCMALPYAGGISCTNLVSAHILFPHTMLCITNLSLPACSTGALNNRDFWKTAIYFGVILVVYLLFSLPMSYIRHSRVDYTEEMK